MRQRIIENLPRVVDDSAALDPVRREQFLGRVAKRSRV
ncbi:hypothetical protein HLRTI_003468, partial [Halorhabdus tiamatea SARL4B]